MPGFEFGDKIDGIKTREDLVRFIQELRAAYTNKSFTWDNNNLDSFLDALAAWTHDMDGYYKHKGMEPPKEPTWRTFADMLMAATMYE